MRALPSRCCRLGLLAVAVSLSGCRSATGPASDAAPRPVSHASANTADSKAFADASNRLGFSLYKTVAAHDPKRNILISPVSLELALSMTYNGAAGTTAEEMAATLGLTGKPLSEVNSGAADLLKQLTGSRTTELLLADGLFVNRGVSLLPEFARTCRKGYRAEARTLDFSQPSAVGEINAWASDRTKGMVPSVVDAQVLQQALVLLVNTLYFRGQWQTVFQEHQTWDGPFHTASGETKTVRMMHRDGVMDFIPSDTFKAVRLPYRQGEFRMVVVLPSEGTTPTAWLNTLTAEKWAELMAHDWTNMAQLGLPRFRANTDERLNEALLSLGMKSALTGAGADFSRMTDPKAAPPGLFITDVLQRCALEVDERGTKAAATTVVSGGMGKGPGGGSPKMIVDRPFALVVEHVPTGAIVLMGSIGEPE
jgi:serine protease inhibitor